MVVLELLEDPAYRHMLINHLPIFGLLIAFLVLVCGAIFRNTGMLYFGMVLAAITAASGYFVAGYGDDAYPAIFDTLGHEGRAWLDYHAELAAQWLWVIHAAAVTSVAALVLGVWRRKLLLPCALVVAAMALAGAGSAIYIAQAGGKIKHPEFRLVDPPQ